MKKWEQRLGKTFNSLTLTGVKKVGSKYPGIFKCECGNECLKDISQVVSGKYKSCGCKNNAYRVASKTKHGHAGGRGARQSSEYNSWRAMRERCRNPNNKSYADYGSRGITVCDRWDSSFENFYIDMGPKPDNTYTLERVNNEIGYSPDNCIWASRAVQSNNQRSRTNATGYKGVVKSSNTGYSAQICINYKHIYLGTFPTAKEAHLEYLKAKRKSYTQFHSI